MTDRGTGDEQGTSSLRRIRLEEPEAPRLDAYFSRRELHEGQFRVTSSSYRGSAVAHTRKQRRNNEISRAEPALQFELERLAARLAEEADNLLQAAAGDDAVERGRSGLVLKSTLREMWALRAGYQGAWVGALTFLQGSVERLEMESIDVGRAQALEGAIDRCLRRLDVTEKEVALGLRRLAEGGFDLFAPISSPEAE